MEGEPPWFYNPVIFAANNRGRGLNAGELGCAASHIRLWQELVDSGEEFTVIFEDDAILSPRLDREALHEVVRKTGSHSIMLLDHSYDWGYSRHSIELTRLAGVARYPGRSTYFTGGYVIGRNAAGDLLRHLRREKLRHNIDWWYRPPVGFALVAHVRAIFPPPVTQSASFISQIQTHKKRYRKSVVLSIGELSRGVIRNIRKALERNLRPRSMPGTPPCRRSHVIENT
jgi:GR25 family glycosyltransferase involved in LPS biosynthesis